MVCIRRDMLRVKLLVQNILLQSIIKKRKIVLVAGLTYS